MPKTICLALTGASGMPYGLRLLDCLLAAGCRVQLLYSQAAQVVARQEMDLELPSRPADARNALLARLPSAVNPENLQIYGREEWFAPVASGSNPPDAMVICPCSMGTLAAVDARACRRSRAAEARARAGGRAGGSVVAVAPEGTTGDAPGGADAAREVSCSVMPW